jgi:phenylpyruvate tautomerase PptA (4-oxalocrotonate tautomerase family)
MPYIQVNTSKKLNEQDKDAIKSKLGELISILPGKSESVLMVGVNDSDAMYFGGEKKDLAFVDVRLFKESDFESKSRFTEAVFLFLKQKLGIAEENVFLSIGEYNTWGHNGRLKR